MPDRISTLYHQLQDLKIVKSASVPFAENLKGLEYWKIDGINLAFSDRSESVNTSEISWTMISSLMPGIPPPQIKEQK